MCNCEKKSYDKRGCQTALNALQKNSRTRDRSPCRCYKCPDSDVYHLTSREDNDGGFGNRFIKPIKYVKLWKKVLQKSL
jgi:hypothetical protein